MSQAAQQIRNETGLQRPRVAFAGLGWIGRNRLEAIAKTDLVQIPAMHDVQMVPAIEAAEIVPRAALFSSFEELLNESLDGLVIATPNAFHAEQTIAAIERGIAVFCQKPLAREAEETRAVLNAARQADCLLGVDLSYRFIPGMRRIRELVQAGTLGRIFSVDLKFHNGYGPDKPWFYDRSLAGGGCVLDLGIHLIDLALWTLDFPEVVKVSSLVFAKGVLLPKPCAEVEDYATALIELDDGVMLNLSCSWNLSIGADAAIEIVLHGTEGGAALRNLGGSFYDFTATHYCGRHSIKLSTEEDSHWKWGGLAALDWCERLAAGQRFNAEADQVLAVAETIDRIYGKYTAPDSRYEHTTH